MMQCFGSRASQVEVLTISGGYTRPIDTREFCKMFSNLRVFESTKFSGRVSEEGVLNQPFEPVLPDTKLEIIKEIGTCELTKMLIRMGSCTRLRELELVLYLFDNPRQSLCAYMNNIPYLRKLTLRGGNIGIQDCKIVHSNLPALHVFYLASMTLDHGQLPENTTMNLSFNYLEGLEIVTYYEEVPYGFSVDSTDGSPVK